ncbi:MAG: DMT family transporter [Gemmatimonadales bacterium]
MLRGELFNVIALLLWAVFTVGIRQVALGLNSAQVSAWAHLGGTPGFLLMAAPELLHPPEGVGHPAVWTGVLYSSVLSSVVASILWTRGLKALGGSRTALYNCVTPLVAGAVAWVVLAERPVAIQLAGAALVVVGILVSREPMPAAAPKAQVEI